MRILTALHDLTDKRRDQSVIYKLEEIIFCSIIAVICDANSYRDVESFIRNNFKLLKKKKALTSKTCPAYTTIRSIILMIDKEQLSKIISDCFSECIEFCEGKNFCIDGKSIKGSYDTRNETSAAHILEVFEVNLGITIEYKNVRDEKTNEIPVAQSFLSRISFEHCLFTADALHCQERTVDICISTGNDLLVQVKENQKDILKTCHQRVKIQRDYEAYTSEEKGHGRYEKRITTVYRGIPSYTENWSKKFQIVVKVERTRRSLISGVESTEESYYLCTKKLSAKEAGKIIREHWSIENRQNHVLDETFREDYSRIRVKPEIFSMFRIIALNIMRLNGIQNIMRMRKEFAYGTGKVFNLRYL